MRTSTRRVAAIVFLGAWAAVGPSCGGPTENNVGPDPVTIASVNVNPSTFTLTAVGATVSLTATAVGKLGPVSVTPSWASDAPSIVSVSGSGSSATATAQSAGTAHITATAGGVSGTTTIVVALAPVASVTIGERVFTLPVGGNKQLTAQPKDAGGSPLDRPITWSPVNPTTATVSAAGMVTGVAAGTARIVATSETKTDTAVVTVTSQPAIQLSSATLTYTAAQGGANPASQAITITNAGTGTLSGLSIGTISYTGGGAAGWLGTPTLSGTTASPSLTLTAQPTTGSLTVGTYTATIQILSGVAINSPQTVTVTFNVTGVPVIALSTSVMSFSASPGGPNPGSQAITISNTGTGTLSGLSVGAITYTTGQPTGWLGTPTLSGSTANPSVTMTVQPVTGTLVQGTYTATIAVVSSVATNSPQTLTVTFVVSQAPPPSPAIGLSATTLSFGATQNGANPANQAITISNSGGGTLNGLSVGTITYPAGQPTGWLGTPTLSSATASPTSTVTVQPVTGALVAGTYTATIPVVSGVASNSPRTITVTFTVTAGPQIALSSTSLTFNASQGAVNPASQAVTITNGGAGTLSGLSVGAITYTAGQPTGWLGTATLNGTTANPSVTLTVQPTTGTLAQGSYTATIAVQSAVAVNTPRTVTVTFTVTPPSGPFIASLTTNPSPPAASQTFNFTITGSNFDPATAQVLFDGPAGGPNCPSSPCVFANASLSTKSTTALVGNTTLFSFGSYNVSVRNGASGTPSNTVPLTATAAPGITSVSPNPVTGSATAQSLTITGANFVSGAIVTLRNVSSLQTFPNQTITSFSPTQIIINSVFGTAAANWTVEVTNPNGQSSSQYAFSVVAVGLSVTGISTSPSSPLAGQSFTFTITGTNFVPGTVQVLFSGPGACSPTACVVVNGLLTTKTATTVSGPVTVTTAGAYSVSVQNGSGTPSNTVPLTVSSSQLLTVGLNGLASGQVTSVPSGIACNRSISITSGVCNYAFATGTNVTLTADAGINAFGGWGGACSGTALCQLAMTVPRTVTGSFDPPPPGTVVDLHVTATTTTTITLAFTEVTNGAGQPANYDVRFARAPIDWGTAASVTSGSCSTPLAGVQIFTVRSCMVTGLTRGTAYQFQLVGYKGTLNVNASFGALSNVAAGSTQP